MLADGGRLAVTFNGEIYNYRALKAALEKKGHRFRSNSDTEVLVHLYADQGVGMVHALRGMYAFAIWNDREKELLLARDPLGIKPLYYADNGETLRFASQVKALLKGGSIDTEPEPAGAVGFLIWGSVPEPFTLHRGIRSLPAGSYLYVKRSGRVSTTRYFDVGDEFRKAQVAPRPRTAEAQEILNDALADSVRSHMVSDVPVGLFLSAGIDSSTVAGLASAQQDSPLNAVTLGFCEFVGTPLNEVPLAAAVAQQFGINHQSHWIAREHFESEASRFLEAMDQPSIDGVNSYFVSRAAAAAGMKVALSGLGGDELFGGYPSFRQVPALVRSLWFARPFPWAGRAIRRCVRPYVGTLASPKYASMLEYGTTHGAAYFLRRALFMPWELESMLDRPTATAGLETLGIPECLEAAINGVWSPWSRVATLELSWYMRNQLLRDADWAGMAHSLEVRFPLVDVQLFSSLAPLIVSDTHLTKQNLARTVPNLPAMVTNRRKTGFVTPLAEWASLVVGGIPADRGLRTWAKWVFSQMISGSGTESSPFASDPRSTSGSVPRTRLSGVAN
jgi:asparagine synthase (glutamine-hydrolysing)